MSDKVKHKRTPAEPWAKPNEQGTITRTYPDGPLRITPAGNGAPAMAHVSWNDGSFSTWERLCDLTRLSEGKRR
jgi:hypothetical protein